MKLEELKKGTVVQGLLPTRNVTVVDATWLGDMVVDLVYRDDAGRTGSELVYRDREPELQAVASGQAWSFDADGAMLRLASEAHRIRLAHLFDPFLAVHTSLIEPLPHQITAVYGEMLSRQPLRFLLADDPGAGKTIMAGLLIRELIIRGDVERCLIICPGNLTEQWQDELHEKFDLNFELLTRERIESSPSGNIFTELDLVIARLDRLSRNDELQEKLAQTQWDLVIFDEAHKLAATYFGNELKRTKRYRLGQLVGGLTRHLLLMTATPHNGKEVDFQLFMALLDSDRFEGRFRDGVHQVDAEDLMRRMIKEGLVKFDGTPLFPERRAYTVNYRLSDAEARLYARVTDYVRDEFNRADQLQNGGRRGSVGFALTILQRRLASSPEAIYQSLKRRRKRLETRLQEEKLMRRGALLVENDWDNIPELTDEDLEDLEDAPDAEVEEMETQVLDRATAARTIQELEGEIVILADLEREAEAILRSGQDRKWEELSALLQDNAELFDDAGARHKLVIFTEHRDTLNYLLRRIATLTGEPESIVAIHGGLGREKRREAAARFTQDRDVRILVATDAAGEGINLQRAHLMVNYDLPWNPNRIEQRFGRIHRIGQTEVCHLWNMVAGETREGQVLERLCEKIECESEALKGQVFDVLGKAFGETSLRQLLLDAIRYGDRPEVRARLTQEVDQAFDHKHLVDLVQERALAHDILDAVELRRVREDMERNEARRLQPCFIRSFFLAAFEQLGGIVREREQGRYEIRHVPAVIRARDRQIGTRDVVLRSYERITFEKHLLRVPGQPEAAFICPGHPLLNAVIDLILERHRHLLRRGAVLVDPDDPDEEPRALFYLEHAIRDARTDGGGDYRNVSRRLQFTEIGRDGSTRHAGYAPYLDYRPITPEEVKLVAAELEQWPPGDELERQALSFAARTLVPEHLQEIKGRNEERIRKTMTAVRERLLTEIRHWDNRANELKLQEEAGKLNAKLNSQLARQRADDLQARMKRRLEDLEKERHIAPLPPVVVGGALVVPAGLLARFRGGREAEAAIFAKERQRIELIGMQAVMQIERRLGNTPSDVSADNRGYDIESRDGQTGHLRFLEVKGRVADGTTVTVSRNEILTARNKPERWLLALVQVESPALDGEDPWQVRDSASQYLTPRDCRVHYIRSPFDREPGFAESSTNFDIKRLLSMEGVVEMTEYLKQPGEAPT